MSDEGQQLLNVVIVASERPMWSGEAQYVIIPALSGPMGILPGHEPILTVVNQGLVRVTDADGVKQTFKVENGFASFNDDDLTVAVEDCEVVADDTADSDVDSDLREEA